jgi:hypothetical protein
MKTTTPILGLAATLLLAGLTSPLVIAEDELPSDVQQLAITQVTAQVTRVLVTADETFGGCMAGLNLTANTHFPPGCGVRYVTFSCSGLFTDPVRAYRMLDQAQLALAANKTVMVTVDDSRKHNGYCFASRIDLIK